MPLYTAKIKVILPEFLEIPVFAKSENEALEYLRNETDWHGSGAFESLLEQGAELSVSHVERVINPKYCDWDSLTYCWNGGMGDISSAEAFYEIEFPDLPDDGEVSGETNKLVSQWRSSVAKACSDYDAARGKS